MGNASKKLKRNQKKDLIAPKQDNSGRFNTILIIVASVVAVALVAGAIVATVLGLKEKYAAPGDKVAMSSDHYKVSNAELSYFFYSTYYNQLSSNPYLQYMGLNVNDSLKNQNYPYSGDSSQTYTWYQMFLSSTVESVDKFLVYWERAYEAGLELDDSDLAKIDKTIDTLSEQAKEKGATLDSYISWMYGDRVTEKDVRKALEFQSLAMKQYNIDKDAITDAVTDEEIETAYNENSNSYNYVTYRSYDIKASYEDGASDEVIAAAKAEAKSQADAIISGVTGDVESAETAFVASVYNYLVNQNATLDDESKKTDEELTESSQNTITEDASYTADDTLSEWLFTEGRQAGETSVIEKDDTYTAVILLSAPARKEYATKTVKHILISKTEENYETIANDVLAKWNASDKSDEAWQKLVDEYNDDSASEYKNIKKGEMVTAFEDWCYDESRTAGEAGVINDDTYGCHVMLYVGDGVACWKAEVSDTIVNEKLDTQFSDAYDSDNGTNIYNITVDTTNVNSLSGLSQYCKTLETETVVTTKASSDTAN